MFNFILVSIVLIVIGFSVFCFFRDVSFFWLS